MNLNVLADLFPLGLLLNWQITTRLTAGHFHRRRKRTHMSPRTYTGNPFAPRQHCIAAALPSNSMERHYYHQPMTVMRRFGCVALARELRPSSIIRACCLGPFILQSTTNTAKCLAGALETIAENHYCELTRGITVNFAVTIMGNVSKAHYAILKYWL